MTRVDGARIRRAIDAAESGTSGRIAVHITGERPENAASDTLASAREHFERARLHEHPDRNAVILLVAPRARRFAVFGGEAIDAAAGAAFWQQLVAGMVPFFARRNVTDGIVFGIEHVGEKLREHFPKAPVAT